MDLRDLLLVLDDTDACRVRTAAAAELAGAHDAHLTGLYVVPEPNWPVFVDASIPAEIIDLQERRLAEAADAAKAAFTAAAERAGLSYEYRQERSTSGEFGAVVSRHGRYADLVVVGQYDGDSPAPGGPEMPEDAVLGCGRPVLILPYGYRGQAFGKNVVVAWDASREAARAVSDALPLLAKAESVTVLSIDPESKNGAHGEEPGADIAVHLARHGLNIEVARRYSAEIPAAEALLSDLADRGADLLVMGGYGHSRLREFALGGVTRTILGEMTVPVLMSH